MYCFEKSGFSQIDESWIFFTSYILCGNMTELSPLDSGDPCKPQPGTSLGAYYNITFLDEKVTRCWISSNKMCPFAGAPRKMSWYEWVPEYRVLKYNEANLQKQKDLEKTHMKAKKSKNTKTTAKKETTPIPAPPVVPEKPKQIKAVKREAAAPSPDQPLPAESKKVKIKTEPSFIDEPKMEVKIKLVIPKYLQLWLMDDFDLINHQKKILHLPARIAVDHIIASYVKEKVSVKGLSSTMESTIVQIANRIRDCFNVL